MKNITSAWFWCLSFILNSCFFTSSANLIQEVEGDNFGLLHQLQVIYDNANHQSNPSSNFDTYRLESNNEVLMNQLRPHLEKVEKAKITFFRQVNNLETFSPYLANASSLITKIMKPIGHFTKIMQPIGHFTRQIYAHCYDSLFSSFILERTMHEISDLCHIPENHPSHIKSLALKLRIMIHAYKFGTPLLTNANHIEYSFLAALELLRQKDLDKFERLWTLNVLQLLLHMLSSVCWRDILQDPNQAPVPRGGLELFLLQGMWDCITVLPFDHKYLCHPQDLTFKVG